MEIFLMVAAMSLLGLAVSAIAFAAATHDSQSPRPQERPALERWPVATSGFFMDDLPVGAHRSVPIDALLLQIERHVQLEQAAAEAFHQMPTLEALHSPTMSPLVH